MTDTTLVINEAYRAWQGEGPSAGRLCAIVRLMGCNLACSWATDTGRSPCDESQTWDAERFDLRAQGTRMEAEVVADNALALASYPGADSFPARGQRMVLITGGEPLLWQGHAGWTVLIDLLGQEGARVEVETNGTVIPFGEWAIDAYNCSPKLGSSGMPAERRIVHPALAAHVAEPKTVFKFVAADVADLDEIASLADRYEIAPWRIWVMPAGTDRDALCDLAGKLAPHVIDACWNLTLRQHHLTYRAGEPR